MAYYLSFQEYMISCIETCILCGGEDDLKTKNDVIEHIKSKQEWYTEEVHNGEYIGEIVVLNSEKLELVYMAVKAMMKEKFNLTIEEENNQMEKITQTKKVIDALKLLGGYATLSDLYKEVIKLNDDTWTTKTPNATIRRIVQNPKYFFKVKRGFWALNEYKDKLPNDLI